MKENLFTLKELKPGIQEVALNVGALYSDKKQRERFEHRFSEFLNSDCVHSRIFKQTGDLVIYQTECIIPTKRDQRPPLLLVFGNPASHSVDSGMFFAYEGNRREHRLWRILCKGGILSFSSITGRESIEERNRLRKEELYNLSYKTPFRIGLAVYYTMPSPASGYPWAGVGGLNYLFKMEAFSKIRNCEKERIEAVIHRFVSAGGAVIAFQKDAYLAIKSLTSPDYNLEEAKEGRLIGNCQCNSEIRLFCLPPTRMLQGKLDLLRAIHKELSK